MHCILLYYFLEGNSDVSLMKILRDTKSIPGIRLSTTFFVATDVMLAWSIFPGLILIWYWTITPFGFVGPVHDISREISSGSTRHFTLVGGPGPTFVEGKVMF